MVHQEQILLQEKRISDILQLQKSTIWQIDVNFIFAYIDVGLVVP